MNYGTDIKYSIEHCCIIDNRYLLLRGWSYAKDSYTKTLISNCGFFLDKVPSMQPRQLLSESSELLKHGNVGFMFYGPVDHTYDQYLNIELVSNVAVIELDIKLKHYGSLEQLMEESQEENYDWVTQLIESKLKS